MSILIPSVIGVALTFAFIAWERHLVRAQQRPEPPRKRLWHYPSVSVIRPVRGADVGARENFAAALDTGYPGDVETLFVFDDESDPGLPIAREVVRAHAASCRPGRAAVLVAGAPPPARTGKLNAMIVGAARARGALIAFGDSDTRPDRELLRELVETLLTSPRAGWPSRPWSSTTPARRRRRALRAHAERALRAARRPRRRARRRRAAVHHGPDHGVQARGARRHRRRRPRATGQLVDDMYIGRRVADAGYRNVLVKRGLKVPTGGLGLARLPADLPPLDGVLAQRAADLVHLAAVAPRRRLLRRARAPPSPPRLSSTPVAALVPALAVAAFVAHALPAQPRLRRRADAAALRLDAGRALPALARGCSR